MTNLVIVESPSKGKTIGKYLGAGFKVMASGGHIRDLPKTPTDSRFGLDLTTWVGEYVVSDGKENTVADLRRAAKDADIVYIASDPDREGEAIAWHVNEILGQKKKTKRATWHEITPKAIQAGLAAAGDIDMQMVKAQEARRFLDRLVGYAVSPWLGAKLQKKGVSAGRVQSVVTRLIVDRDRTIENFVAKPYGGAVLTAESAGKTFRAPLVTVGGLQVVGPDKEGRPGTKVLTPDEAAKLLLPKKGDAVTILDVKTDAKTTTPKAPFTTTSLTMAASNRLGLSTEKTMEMAQKLYDDGLITYMRTDSPTVGAEAQEMARTHIEAEYGGSYLPKSPRQYKAKGEHAQEGHECIRPSHLEASYTAEQAEKLAELKGRFGPKIEDLYDLIHKRFVSCQMADKCFDGTVAVLGFGAGDTALTFKAEGKVVTFDGWEKAYAEDDGDSEEEDDVAVLPPLAKGGTVTTEKCEAQSKKTTPPSAYTEASLIAELDILGIGRPSTIAKIFSTIRDRGYITTGTKGKRKNVLSSTPLGLSAVDALVGGFPKEMDYKYTASMEDDLDRIAEGKITHAAFLTGFWDEFKGHFGTTDFSKGGGGNNQDRPTVLEVCPKCEKGRVILVKTPTITFACCEDKACKTYIGLDENDKAVIRKEPCSGCGKLAVTPGKFGDKCAACGKTFGGGGAGDRPVLFEKCPKCEKNPIILVKRTDDPSFACCTDKECKTYIGLDKADKPVLRTKPCPKCGKLWVTPGKFGDKCAACGATQDKILFEKCPKCNKAPIVLVDIKGRDAFAVCQDKACKQYIGVTKTGKPIIKAMACPKCSKKWVTTGRGGDYCAACGWKPE